MNILAFDTETTGVEPGSRIVELAAILVDEGLEEVSRFQTLINPCMPIPPDATAIHGITDEMVKDAPTAAAALADFFQKVSENVVLMAHNAPYDCAIVQWEAAKAGLLTPAATVIDTLEIARKLRGKGNNNLGALIEDYKLQAEGDQHRAMHDTLMCLEFFRAVGGARGVSPVGWGEPAYTYLSDQELPDLLRETLPYATQHGIDCSMLYEDDKGEKTSRVITPYGWALKGDRAYFHGLCKMRGERRTFRADRVKAFMITNGEEVA